MSALPSARAEGPLLAVRGLEKSFVTRTSLTGPPARVRAVSDVSFDVSAGRTLALVGESGSGKSTTARLVLRLLAPDAGSIVFDDVDWLALGPRELARRRRDVGVVFQDPATSLNPKMRIGDVVAEPLDIHAIGTRRERRERVLRLLASVGLPASAAAKLPSELSGGQRQRVAIARALATEPRFIVLDEPVSALDVSVRAQVLNLLTDLQENTPSRPAYLFIGHDLAVVRQIAERTAVMYLGRIVEEAPTEALFRAPRHPYTRLLLASQPRREPAPPDAPVRLRTPGEPPSPASPPPGCAFHPRCPLAAEKCKVERPSDTIVDASSGQRVACFFPEP